MKKCKLCKEKDLIGKQKLFCIECWTVLKSKGKIARNFTAGILGVALLAFIQKDKIEDFLNGDSDIF